MIRADTFYVAVCDACGHTPDQDGAEYGKTPSEALIAPREENWFQAGDLLICRECQDRPPYVPTSCCGRVLVGQGDDTFDPLCVLPEGHDGSCRPAMRWMS